MTTKFKLFLFSILFLFAGIAVAGDRPIEKHEFNNEVKVWAARSCIGEAGFNRHEECTAILWVLAKRARQAGVPFLTMIRNYSRPVKPRVNHPKPWLFYLDLNMKEKPLYWSSKLKWSKYQIYWNDTLRIVQKWSEGEIADQFPRANEFGGHGDTHRAVSMGMERIATMNGNIFWRSKGAL